MKKIKLMIILIITFTFLMSLSGEWTRIYGENKAEDSPRKTDIPPWTPITGNKYNMICYGNVYKDGVKINTTGFFLGSFGQRGETDYRSTGDVASDGFYYATKRGSRNGETISFKKYDNSTDQIYDIQETITFKSDDVKANFDLNFTTTIDATIPGTATSRGSELQGINKASSSIAGGTIMTIQ